MGIDLGRGSDGILHYSSPKMDLFFCRARLEEAVIIEPAALRFSEYSTPSQPLHRERDQASLNHEMNHARPTLDGSKELSATLSGPGVLPPPKTKMGRGAPCSLAPPFISAPWPKLVFFENVGAVGSSGDC